MANIMYNFDDVGKNIEQEEQLLGKGSMMPFNASNSGSRKLMFGTQLEHRLTLTNPEVAYIQTGYEKEFGRYCSPYMPVEDRLYIVKKISKYSDKPNYHYFLIVSNEETKELFVFERVQYKHITESYGYMYNNDIIDHLSEGEYIEKGTVIKKSTSYDEYDNRQDGINFLVCYGSSEESIEDGIIMSESAAKRMSSPLIKKVPIMINDNEIPLNIYGDDELYKIFPDIGEETKDGLLCALRVEKKEELLFAQSWSRLKEINISDPVYTVFGTVVDINIYPNNIEKLTTDPHLAQLCYYYQENLIMRREIVNTVDELLNNGYTMSYDLNKLYSTSKKILEGRQYYSEKVYNNITMDIVVIENIPIERGDKASNRYGGKGVTSRIRPDSLMPRTKSGEVIDVILNMCGVIGRENLGQLFEITTSYVSIKILEFCQEEMFDVGQCLEMYLDLLKIVAPRMYKYVYNYMDTANDEEIFNFIASMFSDKSIYLIIEPMSENMTIEKVLELYKKFPFVKPEHLLMPIVDSNNNIRYVESRRPLVYGYQYIYRLKQYAEEKFSVTSLSSTNIRNENSRNKSSNAYKALYSRTPIRFGEMESGNLNHLGASLVVQMLMLYSTSPLARRLTEDMITGDPFNIDVRLDNNSINRNAEIMNVYLKEIGLRLRFIKRKKKKIIPILIDPLEYDEPGVLQDPIVYYDKNISMDVIIKDIERQIERDKNKLINPIEIYPIIFSEQPRID